MARSFHFDGAGYLTRSDTYYPRQLYNMAHPALSTSSSVLSSAPSEASLVRDVAEVLAQYSPSDEGDKTRLVLQSFLSELPQEGSNNIRQDIKDCNTDQDLRNLASHLVFHILAPCMYLLTSLTFIEVLSRP